MNKNINKTSYKKAFSMLEILVTLVIGSMIFVTVMAIYSRVAGSAYAISNNLEKSRLYDEILQKIAEDLDRIIAAGNDTKIVFQNKYENGYAKAILKITKTYEDKSNIKRELQQIVWINNYDFDSDSVVLYRSFIGMDLEDKLLDRNRTQIDKDYSYVPVCSNITFFQIQVPKDEGFIDAWSTDKLPTGILVTISSAEPFINYEGFLEVPEEEKYSRYIAIDRTRKIRLVIKPPTENKRFNEIKGNEPNNVSPENYNRR